MFAGFIIILAIIISSPNIIHYFKKLSLINEKVSFYISIFILCIKLMLYFIYMALTAGNLYSLYHLFNAKRYIVTGEAVKEINKIIFNDASLNTLEGYKFADNKKYIIFKPDGYCCIPINNDMIKIIIPCPEEATKEINIFVKIINFIKELVKKYIKPFFKHQ